MRLSRSLAIGLGCAVATVSGLSAGQESKLINLTRTQNVYRDDEDLIFYVLRSSAGACTKVTVDIDGVEEPSAVAPRSVSYFSNGTSWRMKVRASKFKTEFDWSDWIEFKVDHHFEDSDSDFVSRDGLGNTLVAKPGAAI